MFDQVFIPTFTHPKFHIPFFLLFLESRSRKQTQNFLISILSFELKIEPLEEQESPVRHLTPCQTSLPCIASWTTLSQGRSFVHMFQSIAENWFWPLVPEHSARSSASWYPTPLDLNAEFFLHFITLHHHLLWWLQFPAVPLMSYASFCDSLRLEIP